MRRLATALRRQDWLAVAIEFALVVVGVLVALQLDAWNQHREDRLAYAAALDRLRAEIGANLETVALAEQEVSIELPVVRRALDALETCSDDAETLRTVNDGVALIAGTSGLAQRDSALRELTAAPRLLALQSPAVRRRLADLLFYLDIVVREARFYELAPLEIRPEAIPILSAGPWTEKNVSYQGIDYTKDRRFLRLAVPVSVACRSSELNGALLHWYGWQSNLPVLAKKIREEYRLTLELLAEEQGR